ncbi:MAG: UvrB/UvrC motif-containing protein [Candidatus Heteroscillospira sp.]|jgi:protein arginine kinase activator
MKCEKCNEREANFFYTSNINGNVTKRSLCSQCAAEEGLADRGGDMFRDFFRSPFEMLNSFWDDGFFAPASMLGTLTRPVIGDASPVNTGNIPADAGEDMKKKRRLVQLKAQLRNAVESENFEKAIELRDEIRKMEKSA